MGLVVFEEPLHALDMHHQAGAPSRQRAGWIVRCCLAAALCIPEIVRAQGDAPVASLLPAATRYRIQPLDVIELSFRSTPEFNQTATIQPDGYVALLAAGEARLAGLTVPEATAEVARKYGDILRKPTVTLVLKEFHKPFFMVLGHVAHPGKFDLYANTRLQDAIAAAGGCLPGARASEVLLVHPVSADSVEVKTVSVTPKPDRKKSADVVLQPGDAVYVSRSKVGKLDRLLELGRLGFYIPLGRLP